MAETSSSSQWDLIAGSICLARKLHNLILGESNVRIDSARSYKVLAETFIFPVVLFFIIMIADANSSPTQASAEDAGSADYVSDSDQSLSFNLIGNSISSDVLNFSVNSDDIVIPTTVWSLDTNTNHLLGAPSEASTDLKVILGNDLNFADHWPQWVGGLEANSQKAFAETSFSSMLFGEASFSSLGVQVASCSGSSAEHSNLSSCDINLKHTKTGSNYAGTFDDNGSDNTNASGDSPTAATGLNSASASSQESQPPVQPDLLSPVLIPHAFGHHPQQAFSTPPMDDPITSVEDPTPPVDGSIPPVDDPMASIVYDETSVPPAVISIGAPWPVSNPLPIFTPPPESAIPETSTWIMLMIGFGTMLLVVHRNSPSSTKNRLAKASSKIN